ncbi:hypothetical protein Goklo_023778 [Gossypium klotzschianum]|nr:hypothetical protein [Gossypium klotzschianum]
MERRRGNSCNTSSYSLQHCKSIHSRGIYRIIGNKTRDWIGSQQNRSYGRLENYIKKCQSSNTDKSVIGAIIRDIQNQINRFQEIEFTFVPKAKNIYAHTIATEALRRRESFYLENRAPEMVRSALGNLWPKLPD